MPSLKVLRRSTDRPSDLQVSVASEADRRWASASELVAVAALILLGMRLTIAQGLTLGYVVAFGLVPVWLPVIRAYRNVPTFMLLGGLTVTSGIVLTELAQTDHATTSAGLVSMSVLIAGLLAGVGLVLWSREFISDSWIAVWVGVGILLGVSSDSSLYEVNPWRFGYSVAISVIAIGFAGVTRRRPVEIVVVFTLTLISAMSDARSSFAILLLTAILIGWQMRPKRPTRKGTAFRAVVALGGIAIVVYSLGEALILDGILGDTTQQRSMRQVETSGSLILGGRPELAATTALMQHHPWGFGSGTIPNFDDVRAAKVGMRAINYDPDNGYVERYMFGTGFELHSLVGDFWANYGVAGLCFILFVLFLTLRGLGGAIASNSASALFLYLGIKTIWNLFFGPLYSSMTLLALFLGLVLAQRRRNAPTAKATNPSAVGQPVTGVRRR